MNKKLIFAALFGLLTIALASCYSTPKPKRATPKVTTAIVQQHDVPIYIETIGQAISPVTVSVTPQAAGILTAVHITQGAVVSEGEVLYNVDPRPYQAALDQAKAQLAHDQALLVYAEKTVERYKQVVEQDFVSKLTFEQYESSAAAAKAQVDLDKAAIDAAQINLDYCTIKAPVSGKISYFNVDVGNVVTVADVSALTIIRPFSPIDIEFSLAQQQLELIRKVQGNAGEWKFIAVLPEAPDIQYKGTTFFIDNQVNQNTGTILLKGRLSNLDRELWPGEFIKVQVLYRVAPKALVVPPGAVLMGKSGAYLYTVDKDNKAIAHNVVVLTRTNDYIAVQSSEIHAGDHVIIDGQINVAQGMVVNPTLETQQAKFQLPKQ